MDGTAKTVRSLPRTRAAAPIPPQKMMLVSRLQRVARVAVWLLLAFAVVAALVPAELRQATPFLGPVEHFMAYFVIAATFAFGYGDRVRPLIIASLLVLVAAGLEVAQILTPDRHPAILDFVASASGARAGVGLAWLADRFLNLQQ